MENPNDTEDLRNKFDVEAERRIVSHLLIGYPPRNLLQPDTSGLDCLAHLIRHCNALLGSTSSTQLEELNPLLYYAWQDFRPSRDGQIDRKGIDGRMHRLLPAYVSFKDYSESDLMNSTIWSSTEWTLLFDPVTPQNGRLTQDHRQARQELAKASLIEFDCTQNKNLQLQEVVDRHLLERDGRILAPQPPNFIRVRYSSHASDPLPFSGLVAFKLDPVEIDRPNDHVSQRPTLDYSLVAVVRMRKNPQGRDCIKTWTPMGYPTELEETNIISRLWSVSHGNLRFMLVYAQSTRKPGYFVEHYDKADIGDIPRRPLVQPFVAGSATGLGATGALAQEQAQQQNPQPYPPLNKAFGVMTRILNGALAEGADYERPVPHGRQQTQLASPTMAKTHTMTEGGDEKRFKGQRGRISRRGGPGGHGEGPSSRVD